MSKELLQDIIENFTPEKFVRFFREKNRAFVPRQEELTQYNDENFKSGLKLGEVKFDDSEFTICAFKASQPLSERSGKKLQYEKGKKVLKETQSDAGVFIFYGKDGNFRFSLIYANYMGRKRDWSTFRRFTYFVSKEFTNKTFLQRIGDGDFPSLEKIKDAFSVEKVTEEFYEDIANWYFWAVQHSTFPKDAEEEENGRNIAVIRLITRIIFIWFMREQGLVPKNLFEEKSISAMLEEISPESSTYYQAILQNLFFATLNTKKNERKFRSEIRGHKGYNPDFGNQNVFRFQELFKNPEKLKDYFGEIPFLNGGLFECLDDKPNGIYIDGFTAVKKNQPDVPNILFFSGEKKADLNADYGTKSKTYKVRGLLDILSSFNFTIDENLPDDQDIALDPELLGRVFEKLLASFNPKTSTTARKATGSYYTPREIVDYMVTESLKAYFKTHLSSIEDLDKKIGQLFKIGSEENPFNKSESKKIVELIESVRIVDPAVGSGAFPMGALNKLVFILNKVDPGNELWKQAQLSAADTIPDPRIKQDTKNRIEEFFKGKNADYGRKLYLIQKCIYGVDIQQIAVEIAKLRFFISLLVDEGIDKTKENWGIEPLPNLDFKIMQGNSLISEFLGIDFDNGQGKQDVQGQVGLGLENEDDSLIKEFERKKIDYQNESDKDKKAKLKNEVEDLMIKIFEAKLQKKYSELKPIEERAQSIPNLKTREEYIKTEKEKFSKKHGFDLGNIEKQLREFTNKKKTRPFFPWKLYFAEVFNKENPGFDIVIANPPYGFRNVLSTEEKQFFRKTMKIEFPTGDVAELFIVISLSKFVGQNGVLTFIIPKKSLYGESWSNVRKIWLESDLHFLMDASQAFENVLLEQSAFSVQKRNGIDGKIAVGALDPDVSAVRVFGEFQLADIFTPDLRNAQIYKGIYPVSLLRKIAGNSILDTSSVIKAEMGISNTTEHLTFEADNNYPCVKGIDIVRYGLKPTIRYLKGKIARQYIGDYQDDKIVSQKIIAHIQNPHPHILITMFYDNEHRLINDTCVEIKVLNGKLRRKFLLGYLQSEFSNWYAYNFVYNRAVRTMDFINYYVTQIPIPKSVLDKSELQKPFIEIVDKILAITKSSDYLENPAKKEDVKEYEKQIDQMVYELYNLTPEEIAIVEGK